MMMAVFANFFCHIFIGPSEFLGFPDRLWIMIIGQVLIGIANPFLMVPTLPEMIDSVMHKFPDQDSQVTYISSGVFNSFLGFGQVIGPIYGSYVTANFDFRISCDMVAMFCLCYSFIYFMFGNGYEAFTRVRRDKANLNTSNSLLVPFLVTGRGHSSKGSKDF